MPILKNSLAPRFAVKKGIFDWRDISRRACSVLRVEAAH